MKLNMGLLYMKREYYRSYGSMQSHTASYLLTATDAKFAIYLDYQHNKPHQFPSLGKSGF
jgi:hypothetical protein